MCPPLKAFDQNEVLPDINLKVLELAGHFATTNLANNKKTPCRCEGSAVACSFRRNGAVSLQWGKFVETNNLFADLARDFRDGVLCTVDGKLKRPMVIFPARTRTAVCAFSAR